MKTTLQKSLAARDFAAVVAIVLLCFWMKSALAQSCPPATVQECRNPTHRSRPECMRAFETECERLLRCPTPTVQLCRDTNYLPGLSCIPAYRSACQTLLADAAQREATSQPVRRATVPCTSYNRRPDGSCPPTQRVDAHYQPYDQSQHYNQGATSSYYEVRRLRDSQHQLTFPRRLTPDSPSGNHNVVNSCEDYAFKKFYDWSLFESAVVDRHDDARAIFDLAYQAPPQGIANRVLRDRTGSPLPVQVSWHGCMPKNAFYLARRTTEQHDPVIDAAQCDGQESWSWHQTRAQRMASAGFTNDELRENYRKQKEFRTLLSQVANAELEQLELIRELDRRPTSHTTTGRIGDPTRACGLGLDRITWRTGPGGGRLGAGPGDPGGDTAPGGSLGSDLSCPPESTGLDVTPNDAIHQRIASLDTLKAYLRDGINRGIDEAEAMGCRPHNLTTPTPCDWAPELFADWVTIQFASPEETAYASCLVQTRNDFTQARSPRFRDQGGVNPMPPFDLDHNPIPPFVERDYTVSYADLEQYFLTRQRYLDTFQRLYVQRLAAQLPKDSAGRAVRTHDHYAKTQSLGNGMFGLDYAYDFSWAVSNFERDVCQAKIEAKGSLDTTGKLLGLRKQLLHADVDLEPKEAGLATHLTILGQSVFTFEHTSSDLRPLHPDASFNLVDQPLWKQQIGSSTPIAHAEFLVLGVPVGVDAGVSGEVGLALNTRLDLGALVDVCNTNWQVGFETTLKPYASANAWARIYIDLVIVEAGIKGTLTLINVGLPLTAGASLIHQGTSDGQTNETSFSAGVRMDETMETLSGVLQIFAKISIPLLPDISAEVDLIRWSGIRRDQKIFETTFPSVQLSKVNEVNRYLAQAAR